MTNEELVEEIRSGNDIASNMLQLWQQSKRFVAKIARHYQNYAEEDDLQQEGYLGLCDAVEHYAPAAEIKFLTYAGYWIRQRMSRFIRNNNTVRIPSGMMDSISEYHRQAATFKQITGKEPSDREMCAIMGISEKKLLNIKYAASVRTSSTEARFGEDDDLTVGDTLAGTQNVESDVLDQVQYEQLRAVLWPMVDALPGNGGPVIRMRYQENKSLQEVGEAFGFSIEYARQQQNKALRDMRNSKRSRVLLPFLEEQTHVMAMTGTGVGPFNRTWTRATERAAVCEISPPVPQKRSTT